MISTSDFLPSDPLPNEPFPRLLSVEQACVYLRQVDLQSDDLQSDDLQPANPAPQAIPGDDRSLLRRALLLVTQASDYQILGICAETLTQGIQALETYAAALKYSPEPDLPEIETAVYIKFNPRSGLCYASSYSGSHRGVLVSCQSDDDAGVNEMFGHLPLDLFVE